MQSALSLFENRRYKEAYVALEDECTKMAGGNGHRSAMMRAMAWAKLSRACAAVEEGSWGGAVEMVEFILVFFNRREST